MVDRCEVFGDVDNTKMSCQHCCIDNPDQYEQCDKVKRASAYTKPKKSATIIVDRKDLIYMITELNDLIESGIKGTSKYGTRIEKIMDISKKYLGKSVSDAIAKYRRND